MLKSKVKLHLTGFILTCFFLTCHIIFPGCSSVNYQNRHDIEAFNLAQQINNLNKEIKTSKGLGWLKINKENIETVFKIAWITEPPAKIRITLLSDGLPVESIVSNKDSLTLFSHTGKHDLKTYSVKNPSLEDILSIPIHLEDIINLLTGQIPIKNYQYAFFDNNSDNQNYDKKVCKTIILKNSSDRGIQKIFLDADNQIIKYMITDWKIEPVYTIFFLDPVKIDSVTIFSKLLIQDNLDRKVLLEISKFHQNLPVKESYFNLTETR